MGFLLVFDLTNEKSLLSCREWMNMLCHHAYCDRPDVILVGNKSDKEEERVISTSDANLLAQELGYVPVLSVFNSRRIWVRAPNNALEGISICMGYSLIIAELHSDESILSLSRSPFWFRICRSDVVNSCLRRKTDVRLPAQLFSSYACNQAYIYATHSRAR